MLSIVYPPSRIKCVTEDFVSTILCPLRTYQLRSFHSDEFIVSWRMQGNLVNHNSPLDGNIDNNFGVIIRKIQRTEIGLNFNSAKRRERDCYRNPKRSEIWFVPRIFTPIPESNCSFDNKGECSPTDIPWLRAQMS